MVVAVITWKCRQIVFGDGDNDEGEEQEGS